LLFIQIVVNIIIYTNSSKYYYLYK